MLTEERLSEIRALTWEWQYENCSDHQAAVDDLLRERDALAAVVERLREALERCSDMCRWRSSDHYATCEDNCKLGRAEECPADIPRILARGGADEGSEF